MQSLEPWSQFIQNFKERCCAEYGFVVSEESVNDSITLQKESTKIEMCINMKFIQTFEPFPFGHIFDIDKLTAHVSYVPYLWNEISFSSDNELLSYLNTWLESTEHAIYI